MFNYFKDEWLPLFEELGDPNVLQKLDKVYCTAPMGFELLKRFVKNAVPLISVPTLNPKDPETLRSGDKLSIGYFPVGDDVLWGKSQDICPDIKLRIQISDLVKEENLSVIINKHKLNYGELKDGWLEFELKPELAIQGNNQFEIKLNGNSTKPVVLYDLQLVIKYKKAN